MAGVLESGSVSGAAGATGVDWQKRCVALEMQLLRFRLQAGKIRELLAEKMQELEQRASEADQRAQSAERQIHVMEAKLKSANLQSTESESSLYRKYRDLTSQVQEKDGVIKRLEVQLGKQVIVRAQEAKIIEEKATKIKDWVTMKLGEMEQENQQLKQVNMEQTEQIKLLQDKLQVFLDPQDSCGPQTNPPGPEAQQPPISPQFSSSCPGTPPLPEANRRPLCANGEAKTSAEDLKRTPELSCRTPHGSPGCTEGQEVSSDRNNASDELNNKFRSQCLHSSTSAYAVGPGSPESPLNPAPKSPLLPRSPSATNDPSPDPSQPPQSGASMTLPKIRTPLSPRDSIQLAKKHFSQPQPGLDHLDHLDRLPQLVSIDIAAPSSASSTLTSTCTTTTFSRLVEETDIDMEGSGSECLTRDERPFSGLAEPLDRLDPEVLKPPTPPLHRFPSWESRIYAVAKSGLRVSESSPGSRGLGLRSVSPQTLSAGPCTQLTYKNIEVPVYAALKGRATQISAVPLRDDDSGSEDDSGSLASLRTSVLNPDRRGSVPGSPRAVKRGVSMSSMSSESDYAIPPDAYSLDSDYSEPEHKVQRTSSYSCESTGPETLEKSGYLLKMGSRVKVWKRRWFILKNGEIRYYKSPSDLVRKPQGRIELNPSCRILRGEGAHTFQLLTEKKTFYLTADSPNILEDWIRVLQNILKVQAGSPISAELASAKPSVRGWLTKVKHGHSKLVWCCLRGNIFYYFRQQEDQCPLGQLQMREAWVQEVDRSCDSDEAGGRGVLSSHRTLVVKPPDHSPTYLLVSSKQEKDTWLYHLSVAAGGGAHLKVGTEWERLIGRLLDANADAESCLWKSEALTFTKDGLSSPLTTLPSQALQTEALKLFKSCQLFINVALESPSVDYHTSLAQSTLQVCLLHPELQNEMYCQLIKQTNRRTPADRSLTQCWQLLSLCVALFLPQQHFLWHLRQHLHRNADPRCDVGKYAVYCQRSMERTLQNGEREAKPSRMEIVSILLRNPYHHSLPFSIPVHFMNNTYQVVGFDGSTTVEEFLSRLTQKIHMRSPRLSGFALFTDDPSGGELEHFLLPSAKICDVISKWEKALKELHPGKNEAARIVRLTYKNRLCLRSQVNGETERERLLLAYQVNHQVQQGHFPVNKELALEVAALMAQVEQGDLDQSAITSSQGKSHVMVLQMLERFYPKLYKQDCGAEQLRDVGERLAAKWSKLGGCSRSECVRTYLTVARSWTLFGAKLFSVKPVNSVPRQQSPAWLAVNEDGLRVLDCTMHTLASHAYQSVVTFGGCCDDFMLVVRRREEAASGKTAVEKMMFAATKPEILELTLLMASYMNTHWNMAAAPSRAPLPHWDVDSKNFPAMDYTTKVPTLL
ncbi:pleckstrin homology domain-containing family H member 1 isoform X2 [Nerophis ophidion]|uniref:pleckstrin homology domain-containing family H member 1 isoform X2 n=1 Tax=Nerophis ophidion TaxID=159077 RepID=UPI002AE08532|nr:pleckstrin homology domain-containing family H member 1 isoform X2 [Nerophis ophidion]